MHHLFWACGRNIPSTADLDLYEGERPTRSTCPELNMDVLARIEPAWQIRGGTSVENLPVQVGMDAVAHGGLPNLGGNALVDVRRCLLQCGSDALE
eukprot:6213610-Pyramimonas_sp.AAC.1